MRGSRPKLLTGVSFQQIVAALSAALVISVIVVFVEVSFGAMIFSGAFSGYLAMGIGLCLAGALIHILLAALTSSSRNMIAVVQDAPVAIIAAIFVTISASLVGPDEEVMLATGLALIVLTSALAGFFFWALGRFNLGRLVRFIPYPVVGGFLAGTGYLLTVGGIGVMADAPLGQALLQPDLLLRWLPGFLYGVVLLLLLRRFSQFWVMPLLLVGGIAAFYALFLGAGGTLASATADGWLLGPFPSGRLWQPVAWLAVSQADWGLVFANVAKIATALLIGGPQRHDGIYRLLRRLQGVLDPHHPRQTLVVDRREAAAPGGEAIVVDEAGVFEQQGDGLAAAQAGLEAAGAQAIAELLDELDVIERGQRAEVEGGAGHDGRRYASRGHEATAPAGPPRRRARRGQPGAIGSAKRANSSRSIRKST